MVRALLWAADHRRRGAAMAIQKNIIVCSDGTGNTAIKGRGTNVFKLFEAVDLHGYRTKPEYEPQLAIYDDGVGTENLRLAKLFTGAVGWGLGTNVRQLYRELARVYDPGDRIYLFGFSRGAFTARTLAGLINACGIVDLTPRPNGQRLNRQDFGRAVDAAYDAYRAAYASTFTRALGAVLRWPRRADAVNRLHEQYPFHRKVPIAFVGVWDTVDAVGLPLAISEAFNRHVYQFKFPAYDLSACVERAVHALAVDDYRRAFTPLLWERCAGKADRPEQVLEQVWFAGAHSNVGGGYPKQGMSLVALDWLLEQADRAGLHVQDQDRDLVRGHASVDDKLYDPRAGAGVFYRWAPRRIAAMCARRGTRPKLHLSVLERLAHGTDDYAPGNIPFDAEVVFTPSGEAAGDAFLQRRAMEVEAVLRVAGGPRKDLLEDAAVAGPLRIADLSYWIFMVSWPLLVVLPLWARARFGGLWAVLAGSIPGVLGFVSAWVMSWVADRRMGAHFAEFWHHWQPALRAALRRAREDGRGMSELPKPAA